MMTSFIVVTPGTCSPRLVQLPTMPVVPSLLVEPSLAGASCCIADTFGIAFFDDVSRRWRQEGRALPACNFVLEHGLPHHVSHRADIQVGASTDPVDLCAIAIETNLEYIHTEQTAPNVKCQVSSLHTA